MYFMLSYTNLQMITAEKLKLSEILWITAILILAAILICLDPRLEYKKNVIQFF
jgi:hypothetical protein